MGDRPGSSPGARTTKKESNMIALFFVIRTHTELNLTSIASVAWQMQVTNNQTRDNLTMHLFFAVGTPPVCPLSLYYAKFAPIFCGIGTRRVEPNEHSECGLANASNQQSNEG